MEIPMRVYGLTLPEIFLEDFLTIVGWLLVVFAVVGYFVNGFFGAHNLLGGATITLTVITGLVLILASSGIRQNYAALDLSYLLMGLSILGWLISGVLHFNIPALVAGVILLLLMILAIYLRRLAIQARFKPRFFSLRQFETMVQIADTMIDTDGNNALNPIEIAIRTDHFLDSFDALAKEDIKSTLTIVEWLLPLIVLGRPFPFSTLGSHERRRAVEKIIGARGIFRDVARFLKLLACAGYYGSEEGMQQVGYIPFEERERSRGVNQAPQHYPDPFLN